MSKYDGDIIVDRIRSICKKKGISIKQMEGDLDWSQGLISRWTRNSPSIAKIMDVVNYLGIGYEELLGNIDSTESDTDNKESVVQKLYNATKLGELEWKICNEKFPNNDVQDLLNGEENIKIYYTAYIHGFFLLIIQGESLKIGALYNKGAKIYYPGLDDEDENEDEILALLGIIDQEEYGEWSNVKTKYFVEQFMQTDFNLNK